jgi:alginate O-acetyltransferase complex protein AlgI
VIFNTLQFIVFFIVVTLLFFEIKNQKGRIALLLVASCYFYMAFIPVYLLILGATIVVDYFAGIQIQNSSDKFRKTWLVVSLIANIGVLAVFKYYNFFLTNIETLFSIWHFNINIPALAMALPIGLSFHTFQAMSYTIEVYRKKQPVETNFLIYAVYVMFYPQLVAGPIERPQNILHQLHEFRPYNASNVKEGLSRMMWGFFKKCVIADRLAMVSDYTHAHIDTTSSLTLCIGAVFYSFQIYCDFSGYSDIAIGAAKVMNINLMENFRQPYLAGNPAEFWSRWHISLSTWFRDYVYIPLGGNRKGNLRRRINVGIVFLLSGLWHGANWTFVVWGCLHGLWVMLQPDTAQGSGTLSTKNVVMQTLRMLINFCLVTVLWLFFRAENIGQAIAYCTKMFSFRAGTNYSGIHKTELCCSVFLIALLLWREYRFPTHLIKKNSLFYLYFGVMAVVCYYLGVYAENQFIYFQF